MWNTEKYSFLDKSKLTNQDGFPQMKRSILCKYVKNGNVCITSYKCSLV